MKTLIWKEFREHVRWLPMGLVVVSAVAWMATPGRFESQTLIAAELVKYLAITLPLLAFALGVVQSYRDLQPGAGDYLAHRAVRASDIFFAKVVTGLALYAAAVALPLLVLAAWIALQGMTWYPMRPAQVVPAMVFALTAFLMHPAAMLMMARRASWWGTRLFPLAPAGAALIPFAVMLGSGGLAGAGYGMAAALGALVWLLAIARQGWRELTDDPPAARVNYPLRRRWLLPTYLALSAVVVVIALVSAGIVLLESLMRPDLTDGGRYRQLAVDAESGDPWLLTFQQQWNAANTGTAVAPIGGDVIAAGKTVNPLAPLSQQRRFDNLALLMSLDWGGGSGSDGFFSGWRYTAGSGRVMYAYDERGYLLGYGDGPPRWQRTVAADGVYPAGQLSGQPFTHNPASGGWQIFAPLAAAGYQLPLIDSAGVYLLEEEPPGIRKIIDRPIEAAAMFASGSERAPRLIVRSDGTLLEYRLVDASGSEQWFEKQSAESMVNSLSRPLDAHGLTALLVRSVALPAPLLKVTIPQLASTDSGFVIVDQNQQRLYHLAMDGSVDAIRYEVAPETDASDIWDGPVTRQVPIVLLPGLTFVVAGAAAAWAAMASGNVPGLPAVVQQNPVQAILAVTAFGAGLLASLVLAVMAARTRELRRGQLVAWCLATPLLGLATPLAVLAIYRAVHREPCPQCERQRRVDQSHCPHCGAAWEAPPAAGIEIHDQPQALAATHAGSLV